MILNDQTAIGHCIETDATSCLQLKLTLPNENLAGTLATLLAGGVKSRERANRDSQKTQAYPGREASQERTSEKVRMDFHQRKAGLCQMRTNH